MAHMDDKPNLVERLRTVNHFRYLSLADVQFIVNAGQIRRVTCGETLFDEGEPCSGMFVLVKGRIHLCKLGPQGQVNILSVVEPVIMFNEVAVIDGGPNPVSAIAAENSLLWQINYAAFQDLLNRIPQVGSSLLIVLAKRNRQMIVRYEDLSFRSVLARTAKLLLYLSAEGSRPIDRRACSIQEMANLIATVPEAISRSLGIIKNQGMIKTSRAEIVVLSTKQLADLAQVESILGGEA
jgi:CRP-like cAMP-binding protein